MKALLGLMFLCFSVCCFGQAKVQTGFTKAGFLLKSKRQQTTGFILLAGGAAMFATGMLIPEGEVTGHYVWPDWSDEHKNDGIKSALSLTGVVAMLGSVPFLIASSNNKRLAARVSFSEQKIYLPEQIVLRQSGIAITVIL